MAGPFFIYADGTGRVVDVDLRGTEDEVVARLSARDMSLVGFAAVEPLPASELSPLAEGPRGRGRPKLGVVAREVTLLPRHWEWLGAQPGGASVALRKLVEEARRTSGARDRRRAAREAAHHFMTASAGDLPGFEEALRALYGDDRLTFVALIAGWPADVRGHAIKLAFADLEP